MEITSTDVEQEDQSFKQYAQHCDKLNVGKFYEIVVIIPRTEFLNLLEFNLINTFT